MHSHAVEKCSELYGEIWNKLKLYLDYFRYYIKGEHEGKSEVFAQNLPGFPDNIRLSSKGGYWVGIATVRTDFFDLFQLYPRAKSFTAKVGMSCVE